jgi:hypothetical protein
MPLAHVFIALPEQAHYLNIQALVFEQKIRRGQEK